MADLFSSDTPLVPAKAARNILGSRSAPDFDLDGLITNLRKYNFCKICLQFPDHLLPFSVNIYNYLKAGLECQAQLFISADTTYGACCVDFVSAKHVDADIIVHFGPACLSPTSSSVIYMFEKLEVDSEVFAEKVSETITEQATDDTHWIIICDGSYNHAQDALSAALNERKPRISLHKTQIQTVDLTDKNQSDGHDGAQRINNRSIILPNGVAISACNIIYIGTQNLYLNNLVLTNPNAVVLNFDPISGSSQNMTGSASGQLMKRFAVVQQVKDADVFGLVVGTLGISLYAPLIKYIREMLSQAGKKSYTLAVGKLNPAKLGNFPEIECFVLIACPENTLIDSKEFSQPIATPFELQLGLGRREWDGSYQLDFQTILDAPIVPRVRTGTDSDSDEDRPHFSLITGKYKYSKKFGGSKQPTVVDSNTGELVIRNQDQALSVIEDSAGGDFLSRKSFRGLESRIGMDEPATLSEGLSGVARGYIIEDDDSRGSEDLKKRLESLDVNG